MIMVTNPKGMKFGGTKKYIESIEMFKRNGEGKVVVEGREEEREIE